MPLPPLGRPPPVAQFEVETTTLDSVGLLFSGADELVELVTLFDGLFEYLESVKLFSCDETERLYGRK